MSAAKFRNWFSTSPGNQIEKGIKSHFNECNTNNRNYKIRPMAAFGLYDKLNGLAYRWR